MRFLAALTVLTILSLGVESSGAGQTIGENSQARAKSSKALVQEFYALQAKNERLLAIVRGKPVSCKSAEKAIVYYRNQVWKSQKIIGEKRVKTTYPERKKGACGYKRWQAREWQIRAKGYRARVAEYNYHYAWWSWMPDKWQRIGACETGYGKRPGNFRWNSGKFQGFAGFYYGTWDQYKIPGAPSEAYLATPRQQYETALRVYDAHGYGAWGCGGA